MRATSQFLKEYDKEIDKDRLIRAVNEIAKTVKDQQILGFDRTPPKFKQINNGVGEYFQKHNQRLWQYDIPPGNKARMLYAKSSVGEITLLDYSLAHDVLEEWKTYKNPEISSALASSRPAPRILYDIPSGWDESPLTTSKVGQTPQLDPSAQFEEDWLGHLDSSQLKTRDKILQQILTNPNFSLHLVVGPAGSGKTIILTELAIALWNLTGNAAEVLVPKGVEEYLKSASKIVPGLGKSSTPKKAAILLDDPIRFDDLQLSLLKAKVNNLPLVVSIDPVQWSERDTLLEFSKFLNDNPSIQIHKLKVVYRQAENVGRPALEVLTAFLEKTSRHTDPYKDSMTKGKIAAITDISVQNVTFAVEHGSYRVVQPKNWIELVSAFIDAIVDCAKFESIRSWPQLLIGTPISQKLPKGFPEAIEEMKLYWGEKISTSKFNVHVRSFEQLELIRGTEYENVIILIESHHWNDLLNGVKNVTARTWDELSTPLTFLTRGINRCSILVIPDEILEKSFVDRRYIHADEKLRNYVSERMAMNWSKEF